MPYLPPWQLCRCLMTNKPLLDRGLVHLHVPDVHYTLASIKFPGKMAFLAFGYCTSFFPDSQPPDVAALLLLVLPLCAQPTGWANEVWRQMLLRRLVVSWKIRFLIVVQPLLPHDWCRNATTISRFWKTWNVTVHRWALRWDHLSCISELVSFCFFHWFVWPE